MREIAEQVTNWLEAGNTGIAVGTVLKTFGSAPRKEGSKLAYVSSGHLTGSISGGCVESAIIDEAAQVIADGEPKLVHFDTSDDEAWEVGLPCGGSIDVLVEPLDVETFAHSRAALDRNERLVTVTILPAAESGAAGSGPRGKLSISSDGTIAGHFPAGLRPAAIDLARHATSCGRAALTDTVEVFVDVVRPMPTLVAVGGVHTAMAMVGMAKILGFITWVVDPRQTFSSDERFPGVDRLIKEWPQKAFEEYALGADSAIVVLTHDPKLDDPALESALRSNAFYIGALGSPRTQERRLKRLGEAGFDRAALARIHGPVGLDIGAETPEQIALAILAEVVAVRNGKDGPIGQLRGTIGAGRAAS